MAETEVSNEVSKMGATEEKHVSDMNSYQDQHKPECNGINHHNKANDLDNSYVFVSGTDGATEDVGDVHLEAEDSKILVESDTAGVEDQLAESHSQTDAVSRELNEAEGIMVHSEKGPPLINFDKKDVEAESLSILPESEAVGVKDQGIELHSQIEIDASSGKFTPLNEVENSIIEPDNGNLADTKLAEAERLSVLPKSDADGFKGQEEDLHSQVEKNDSGEFQTPNEAVVSSIVERNNERLPLVSFNKDVEAEDLKAEVHSQVENKDAVSVEFQPLNRREDIIHESNGDPSLGNIDNTVLEDEGLNVPLESDVADVKELGVESHSQVEITDEVSGNICSMNEAENSITERSVVDPSLVTNDDKHAVEAAGLKDQETELHSQIENVDADNQLGSEVDNCINEQTSCDSVLVNDVNKDVEMEGLSIPHVSESARVEQVAQLDSTSLDNIGNKDVEAEGSSVVIEPNAAEIKHHVEELDAQNESFDALESRIVEQINEDPTLENDSTSKHEDFIENGEVVEVSPDDSLEGHAGEIETETEVKDIQVPHGKFEILTEAEVEKVLELNGVVEYVAEDEEEFVNVSKADSSPVVLENALEKNVVVEEVAEEEEEKFDIVLKGEPSQVVVVALDQNVVIEDLTKGEEEKFDSVSKGECSPVAVQKTLEQNDTVEDAVEGEEEKYDNVLKGVPSLVIVEKALDQNGLVEVVAEEKEVKFDNVSKEPSPDMEKALDQNGIAEVVAGREEDKFDNISKAESPIIVVEKALEQNVVVKDVAKREEEKFDSVLRGEPSPVLVEKTLDQNGVVEDVSEGEEEKSDNVSKENSSPVPVEKEVKFDDVSKEPSPDMEKALDENGIAEVVAGREEDKFDNISKEESPSIVVEKALEQNVVVKDVAKREEEKFDSVLRGEPSPVLVENTLDQNGAVEEVSEGKEEKSDNVSKEKSSPVPVENGVNEEVALRMVKESGEDGESNNILLHINNSISSYGECEDQCNLGIPEALEAHHESQEILVHVVQHELQDATGDEDNEAKLVMGVVELVENNGLPPTSLDLASNTVHSKAETLDEEAKTTLSSAVLVNQQDVTAFGNNVEGADCLSVAKLEPESPSDDVGSSCRTVVSDSFNADQKTVGVKLDVEGTEGIRDQLDGATQSGNGDLSVPENVETGSPQLNKIPVASAGHSSVDGNEQVVKTRTKPFNFLIRIPRFDDENLREQIRVAKIHVDEKTKLRDAVQIQIQEKRANSQVHGIDYEYAKSEARSARKLVRSKRMEIDSLQSVINKAKNALSIEDIDSKIYNMEHMIQHETLPLKEEKQLIRDIKQSKQLREQLSSNMGSQDEIKQAIEQRGEFEENLKVLRKELDNLKTRVLKAEAIASEAEKKYDDENKKIKELQAQFRAADDVRQTAYVQWQNLRKDLSLKSEHFFKYRDDAAVASNYAYNRDIEALYLLCTNQVDNFMDLWNRNEEFRKEYAKFNTRSTVRRFGSLDGRTLGPDEVAPRIPSYADERASRMASTSSDKVVVAPRIPSPEVKQETTNKNMGLSNKVTKSATESNHQKVAKEAAVSSVQASGLDTHSVEEHKETIRSKEEIESLRREEEKRREEIEAKLKEQRRVEALAKANEARERKKRQAEKLKMRADIKTQKEAEEREKEREKRLRKKERKKASATDGNDTNNSNCESGSTVESTTESSKEREVVNETHSKKQPQKPRVPGKQTKSKSIPPPLRNRNKKKMQQWMWLGVTSVVILVLFWLGNIGMFSKFVLKQQGPVH